MVSASEDVVGNARGEGGNECNESASLLKVLLELGVSCLLRRAEHREHGGNTTVALALGHAGLFELVRVLGEHSHGNVVVSTHGLSRKVNGAFALVEIFSELDESVVSVLGNRGSVDVAALGEVNKNVVSSALVVRRALIVERSGVVLGLELVAGSLGDSLDGGSSVGSTHHLAEGSSSNERAEDTDFLNKGTN